MREGGIYYYQIRANIPSSRGVLAVESEIFGFCIADMSVIAGASGGVGSVATAILANLGHEVAAVTGVGAETSDYLTSLGASRIVPHEELAEPSGRPLESETWAGIKSMYR